jgi:hypothetical protein
MRWGKIKKRRWTGKIVMLVLGLAWAAPSMAVNIQVGGGQKLDLSRFQIVHQETFDSGQSPDKIFWGVLDVGQKADDPWTGMLTKDAYALTNAGQPGAVRYYFRQSLDGAAGGTLSENALSVDIGGTMNGKISGAGLLYAFNPRTKHYLAFVIGKERSYAIYKRNGTGLRKIINGTSKAVQLRRANRLAIVPDGSGINFYINGTRIAALKDETTSGGAGILAISSGMFLFDNFTLYEPSGYEPSGQNPLPATTAPDEKEAPRAPEAALPLPTDHRAEDTNADARAPEQVSEPQQQKLIAYQKVLKAGMPKQQVLQMFGPPAYQRGQSLIYELGREGSDEANEEILVIQFDDDDTVSKYQAVKK